MVQSLARLMERNNSVMSEEKFDFEKSLKRLEQIADQISSGDLSLDESLALYKEGQELIKKLETALKEAEEKVEQIIETK